MKISNLKLENNILLAPMAGITNLPYRRVMKHFGAGLVFSEMVSANGLVRSGRRTIELLSSAKEEQPFAIQLFGEDPAALSAAAEMVQDDCDLLDLNLGCPVKKVVRSGAGSALMRDPRKVGQVISAVRHATDLPLTVKIRSGWDAESINFLEIGRIAVEEGADAITLHPRTRSQGFGGRADWSHIRELKEAVTVPVIGSGDIFSAADALAMTEQTGCDGVMIGRGSFGNPWLIRDILVLQSVGTLPPEPTILERLETACWHLDLFIETFGEKKAIRDMRKHLCWYSRGIAGAAFFRTQLNKTDSLKNLRELINDFFALPENALRANE